MATSCGSNEARHVVILGAGYAGVMAANRLLSSLTTAEQGDVRVTVVNPRPRFVERVRLHEVVAGTVSDVSRPLREILHSDAQVVVGEARLIEPERNVVHVSTEDGSSEIGYDELVYAVGSRGVSHTPGAREHAFSVADAESADRAAHAIAALPATGHVVVVGGGLTGVETASEIAETRQELRVTLLVGSGLLPGFGEGARKKVERTLRRLGVETIRDERVRAVREGELALDSERLLPFDACVWAAGLEAPDLAATSGLAVDASGRLRVDENLTAIQARNIVGAGDCIVLPVSNGAHLRMGCAAALPLGGHAAETLLHHLRGTPAAAASVGFVVQCLSLGRRRGVIQVVSADDRPKRLVVTGRAGAWVKEFVCKLAVAGPTKERTRPGSYKSPKGPVSRQPARQSVPRA
ncbi:MAG: FAD-dependent oxidoreductase [Leifsonia sp.]